MGAGVGGGRVIFSFHQTLHFPDLYTVQVFRSPHRRLGPPVGTGLVAETSVNTL